MDTREQLIQARKELRIFKNIIAEDDRIDHATYGDTLERMRYMQQQDPTFQETTKKIKDHTIGSLGLDVGIPMAMGQLNIEARIRNLEAQAQREGLVIPEPVEEAIVAPPQNIAPEPEVINAPQAQKVGKWQRVKNWFKRKFTKKQAEATNPSIEPAAQEVIKDNRTVISQIMSVTIPSHINDVKRCHTANDTVDTLLTPEEMQRLQQSTIGIRGGDGTCLTQRTKPMTNPMCAGMAEMFDQLKAENFNFKEALSDMKEIPYATKPIKFNEATIAMSLKALKYTMSYLQNEHVQEYIKTVYESFGKVLLDNVRNKTNNPNALPTDDDMDNHALEVLYTRGFDILTPIRFNEGVSEEAKDFAIYTSALLGKMAHLNECVKTCGNNDYINMLTPLVEQIAIFKNTMSQIGAEVRTKRLNEIKNNLQ